MGMARPSKEDELHRSEDSDTQRQRSSTAHRGRAVAAMASAVAEHGYASTTVQDIPSRARMSRRTFYEAALAALFEYLAAEPGLARVWLVEAPSLGAAGVERHERTMKQLAERLAGPWTLPGRCAASSR